MKEHPFILSQNLIFPTCQEVNGTTTPIQAIDADDPNTPNSAVLYQLEGDNADRFTINLDTGIVTVDRG